MKLFTLILFVFTSFLSFGQQDPLFTGEGLRSFWFNPGSYGTHNQYSAYVRGRVQWVGEETAPQSLQFVGEFKGISLGFAGAAIGGGLHVLHDRIGHSENTWLQVPLNVQIPIKRSYLSFGISPGLHNVRFTEGFVPPSPLPDPTLPIVESQSKYSMGAGITWYNYLFSFGVGATHLTAENFDELNYQAARHYYGHASYRFYTTRTFSIRPVAVFRTDGAVSSIAGMFYGDSRYFSVGLGYRSGSSFLMGVSGRFKNLSLSYFAEYTQNPLSPNFWTHEVRLAFEIFDQNLFPKFDPSGNPNF